MQTFIICEDEYSRLQSLDCIGIDDAMPYRDFVNWNVLCYKELSEEKKHFLSTLLQTFPVMRLVDMESATSFMPLSFFFDSNKNICIVSPR